MTPTPDPPPSVPELAGEFAEFDYFGLGPLKGASLCGSIDIASLSFATGKWSGDATGKSSDYQYAIRRGTELHRLNFSPASSDQLALQGGQGAASDPVPHDAGEPTLPPLPVLPVKYTRDKEHADRRHFETNDVTAVGIDFYRNGKVVVILERSGSDLLLSNEVPTPTPQQPGREVATPRTDAMRLRPYEESRWRNQMARWVRLSETPERETDALSAEVARLRALAESNGVLAHDAAIEAEGLRKALEVERAPIDPNGLPHQRSDLRKFPMTRRFFRQLERVGLSVCGWQIFSCRQELRIQSLETDLASARGEAERYKAALVQVQRHDGPGYPQGTCAEIATQALAPAQAEGGQA